MTKTLGTQVRYTACVAVVAGICVVEAMPAPRATAGSFEYCAEFCDPSVQCNEQCWGPHDPEQLPMLITCGSFQGGLAGGMCDGCGLVCGPWAACDLACFDGGETDCGAEEACVDCGDGYCAVEFETRTTCDEDCGSPPPPPCECGDSTCNLQCGERYDNCSSDCPAPGGGGFCGDFVCDDTEGEDEHTCAEDCAVPTAPCEDCPLGWVCVNNICIAPANLFALPTCYAGQQQCACGFKCTVTEYLDSSGHPLPVCLPDWGQIFDPQNPCEYFGRR